MLLQYIRTEVPDTYSDGPSGQNKNHTVVRFLINLCEKARFQTITHNFPERGHSYTPCDRDFGSIKRLLRKVDRIYTPEQYIEVMLKASKRGRFTVYRLTANDIFDFKKWWPQSYKKTTNSDETSPINIPKDKKKPFKISTFKQFLYNQATPGKVIAKEFSNGLTMSTFSLRKCAVPPTYL